MEVPAAADCARTVAARFSTVSNDAMVFDNEAKKDLTASPSVLHRWIDLVSKFLRTSAHRCWSDVRTWTSTSAASMLTII